MINNKKITCVLCKKVSKFFSDYRFNINSDIEYFGDIKLYYCNDCDLAFANPMPEESKLNFFYKYIYRDFGRPHYLNIQDIDRNLFNDKNMNYIQYLSSKIELNKITKIFDFGSGSGDIGFLLKKKYNHLKLYTIENDSFSQKILIKRNYKIFNSFNDIDTKFDLIISTHVFEHLTNLNVINDFKKIVNKNAFIFIETPNNLFHKNFIKRPYDSPHLLFFSKKTFENIKKLFELDISDLTYASHSIDDIYLEMHKTKLKFQHWNKNNRINIKQLIKYLLNSINLNKFLNYSGFKKRNSENSFINGDENSWCIRVLYQYK